MKRAIFAGMTGIGLIMGANAFAQQDLSRPQPQAVSPEELERLEAETDTDLGQLVDDLLEDTAPETQSPQTETAPEQPAASAETGQSRGVDIEVTLGDEEELDENAEEASAAIKVSYSQFQGATLRALDKITGRSTDIQVQADKPIVFGSLNIEMKACYQTPPEVPPESAAFLSIKSTQSVQVESMKDAVDAKDVATVSEDNPKLFSGWMFASSPGLSALEHPVYDVWVINCNEA